MNSIQGEKIINNLIKALSQKPAYLLVFGIWVVFVIFGFGSGAYGIYIGNQDLIYAAFLSFVIALIVAVAVIKIVEHGSDEITDVLFNLVIKEDAKFNNIDKNGIYQIEIGTEKKSGDLLLEFMPPNPDLSWPGGWVWRPPVRINHKSLIKLYLEEDDGTTWEAKKTYLQEKLTIPLYPVKKR